MNAKSFLPVWEVVRAECKDLYEIFSDGLFVEYIAIEPPVTKSGLVLHSGSVKQLDGIDLGKAEFVRVLDVGCGYYDDEREVPVPVQVGDIVLIAGPSSVKWWSHLFGMVQEGSHRVGTMAADQVLWRIKGQAAFDAIQAKVRKALYG